MNEWYFNSLRLTMILSIMILSVFWYIISSSNSICSRFYFYINSITRLSWPLIFLQFLFFGKNAHRGGGGEGRRERLRGSLDRARGRPRRMAELHRSASESEFSRSLPRGPSYDMQMWLMKYLLPCCLCLN